MAKVSRFSVPAPLTPWRAQYPGFHVEPAAGDVATGTGIVTSIADLRALTTFPETVLVQSYYGDGGHGGGMFRWVAGSALADDGGSIIAPADGSAGRWMRVY